jgi:hypothetical protein
MPQAQRPDGFVCNYCGQVMNYRFALGHAKECLDDLVEVLQIRRDTNVSLPLSVATREEWRKR